MVCSARGASCWVVVGWLPKVLMQCGRGPEATFWPIVDAISLKVVRMCWMICR